MQRVVFFGTELALTSSSAESDLNSNLVRALDLFSQGGAAGCRMVAAHRWSWL